MTIAHTTQEQIAELNARHEADARGNVTQLVKTEHIQEGVSPTAKHHVRFTFADGTTEFFASHSRR